MPDLEQQLERLAAAVLDDVAPVTADEVVHRATGGRRSRVLAVAVGVAATLVLVAAVLAVRARTQTVDTLGPGATDSWVRLLDLVPADALDPAFFIVEDLGRMRATGTGPRSYRDEVLANSPAEVRAELGFDHDDVDQLVAFGAPPGGTVVLRGRFDRAAIAAAVAADPIWSPLLEERTYEGVTFWSWGEDYELNDRFSPLRGPGNSARLALVDDVVVWTAGDPELEAVLDVIAGRAPSLADDPDVRLAAEQADARSALSGTLWSREQLMMFRTNCEPDPCDPVLPHEHVPVVELEIATGEVGRDTTPVGVLVYPNDDAAEAATGPVAEAAAERRRQLVEAGEVPPGDPVVERDGRVLVAVGAHGPVSMVDS